MSKIFSFFVVHNEKKQHNNHSKTHNSVHSLQEMTQTTYLCYLFIVNKNDSYL